MCEFISWVEIAGKVLFITDKEHEELMSKGDNRDKSERWGHGAIREYWNLKDNEGVNKECTDFSSPANFPPAVAEAIKMKLMDYSSPRCPDELLETTARKKYEAIKTPAWKEYEAIDTTALKEYMAIETSALKKYMAIETTAFWKLFSNVKNRVKVWR